MHVCDQGNIEVIDRLLSVNADVNLSAGVSFSAAKIACANKNAQIIRMLLEAKLDLENEGNLIVFAESDEIRDILRGKSLLIFFSLSLDL
jgi:ankyrin repeat protein